VPRSGDEIDAWVQDATTARVHGRGLARRVRLPRLHQRRDVREWWAGLYDDFMANGIDGVWNDMNEPAIFNVESPRPCPRTTSTAPTPSSAARAARPLPQRLRHAHGPRLARGHHGGQPRQAPVRAQPGELHRRAPLRRDLDRRQHRQLVPRRRLDPDDAQPGPVGQPFVRARHRRLRGNGDAEMFARWMGFGALCPSPRAHGQGQHRQGALGVRRRGRGDQPPGARAPLPLHAATSTRSSRGAPHGHADRPPRRSSPTRPTRRCAARTTRSCSASDLLVENGEAVGTLYEDAGDGHGHETGEFRLTEFRVELLQNGTAAITQSVVAGDWPLDEDRAIVLRIIEPDGSVTVQRDAE
jgi:hypothetical protein